MGHDISDVNPLHFLKNNDAIANFGKLDYLLKDGMHIQNYDGYTNEFLFLIKYYPDLKKYYETYFGISLFERGEGIKRYYFIDFNSSSRGNIPDSSRAFMKNKYIIIGLILHKVKEIDRYVELDSIEAFKNIVKNDYENYKPGLIKLIAKSDNTSIKSSDDEDRISNTIDNAFKRFKSIGWVFFKDDYFELRPSFNRLIVLYEDVINTIDERMNDLK